MDAPPIQYCRTDDGVNIAYSTLGEGPSALFLNPPAASHLTLEWGVPRFRKEQELYAKRLRLIRLNSRWCGVSGPADDLSFDGFLADPGRVLDVVGGGPHAVISGMQATPLAVGLAAARPEDMSSLILLGPEIDYERRLSIYRALEHGTPAHAGESFLRVLNPDSLSEDVEPLAELIRENERQWDQAGGPARIQNAMLDWQVKDLLPTLTVPTLVVHYPGHAFSDGPNVAGRVPNARLIVREGSNAPVFNPDLEELVEIVTDFIFEHANPPTTAATTPDNPSGETIPLSPREREVVTLVAAGLSNPEIADNLSISRFTVARHISSALAKTSLGNRTELAVYASRHHLA